MNHTDHANLVRLETMDLRRIKPKHYRWFQKIVPDGSLLLHRPGESALRQGPDGISRNPEGRDQLIPTKVADWDDERRRNQGICDAIRRGEADEEDPEPVTIERLQQDNPSALEPLPPPKGLAVSQAYERKNEPRA